MIKFWIQSDKIRKRIFIPRFYDPEVARQLSQLEDDYNCIAVGDLIESGQISVSTGDEIGKAAYGTGDIPFVRTSDIVNWEIKAAPKQGISREIYEEYADKQDVREGDILFVRDGTYLIGTNCYVTRFDKDLLFQSHLLKIRINDPDSIDPHLVFLAFNSKLVQRQIRAFQFTADIIDTIGARFYDLVLPLIKNHSVGSSLIKQTDDALETRVKNKAFIKHCPTLIEHILRTGTSTALTAFQKATDDEIKNLLRSETITSEYGTFESYWLFSDRIKDLIIVPKYYDPSIGSELSALAKYCDLKSFAQLRSEGAIEYHTGDEIGKMAYGTGTIPFIRTSDFGNWEIKHDPKQGISNSIYEEYAAKQDVQENDIFLVRDGTYLVGTSCIITAGDSKCLFSGGLYKIRLLQPDQLDPFLVLGLLNSYIVKRQIRSKQFTRDVIDTLGNRLDEIVLPIPKSKEIRHAIRDAMYSVISERIAARFTISRLSTEYAANYSQSPDSSFVST